MVHFERILFVAGLVLLAGCGSDSSDAPAGSGGSTGSTGGPVEGDADTHCKGMAPAVVDPAACMAAAAGMGGAAGAGGGGDAGAAGAGEGGSAGAPTVPTPGANGDCASIDPDYGDIAYGSEGDDDDCKYHVKWSVTPFAQGQAATFTVTATNLSGGTPVTGAAPRAELFIPCDLTHVPPQADFDAKATETSPGTYAIGPVTFDKAGHWAVRFHFSESCDDSEASPHGHAAFYLNVP